jgi:hypothetical protein
MNDSPFFRDGAKLMGQIVALIHRYIVVSDSGAIASALWVFHAHCFGAADYTPYLFIRSATKRCGKSRFLDLLALLVPKPVMTANITVAALFRTIDTQTPTVFFDEQDGLTTGSGEVSEDLRKILNAGFQRNRPVMRCVGVGSNQNVVEFDVFCPKALAAIGQLPDTVVDRALTIELKRKARSEHVERFRHAIIEPVTSPLRMRLSQWAEQNLEALTGATPNLPSQLDDRAQDIAEPLIASRTASAASGPTVHERPSSSSTALVTQQTTATSGYASSLTYKQPTKLTTLTGFARTTSLTP